MYVYIYIHINIYIYTFVYIYIYIYIYHAPVRGKGVGRGETSAAARSSAAPILRGASRSVNCTCNDWFQVECSVIWISCAVLRILRFGRAPPRERRP